MRSIWSGAISFGLVNIPVKLYTAAENDEPKFNYLHKKDSSPIRYAKICKKEGREVPYEEIVKGYEYQKGQYAILTEEDFQKANVRKTKTIDILDFAQEKEIDSLYFEKPYYLEPDKSAEKSYTLLREALKKSKKVGISKFVLRNKEHLALIKPSQNVIVLNQIRFHDEIRKTAGLSLPKADIITQKEIELALALIDKLTETFAFEKYKDTYKEDLQRVILQKIKGKTPKAKGHEPEPTEVQDLMETLRASLTSR